MFLAHFGHCDDAASINTNARPFPRWSEWSKQPVSLGVQKLRWELPAHKKLRGTSKNLDSMAWCALICVWFRWKFDCIEIGQASAIVHKHAGTGVLIESSILHVLCSWLISIEEDPFWDRQRLCLESVAWVSEIAFSKERHQSDELGHKICIHRGLPGFVHGDGCHK